MKGSESRLPTGELLEQESATGAARSFHATYPVPCRVTLRLSVTAMLMARTRQEQREMACIALEAKGSESDRMSDSSERGRDWLPDPLYSH